VDVVIVAAAVAAVFVGSVTYRELWGPRARINGELASRPRVLIADVGEQPVRVVGVARAGSQVLRAPLTGRACLAYTLKVVDRTSAFVGVVLDLAEIVPFVVVDETGEAVVDPSGARRVALEADRVGAMGGAFEKMHQDERQRLRSLIEAKGAQTTSILGRSLKFAFEEAILAPGGKVAIGGAGTRETTVDGERPALRASPERLVFRHTADNALLISTWRDARMVDEKTAMGKRRGHA